MNETAGNYKVEADREALIRAQEKGTAAVLWRYTRLSGPGWLQSAITLGGGSLAGSLYLGVLGGYGLLWLQPLFMVLGIIMLSAIGYVALSTNERPLAAINSHVNPVLGWSWALATLMANIVWCLPQFSLANSVLQQNLLPDVVGPSSQLGEFGGKVAIASCVLVLTILITWSYGSGHWGIKLYEVLLKLMVASIVICFFVVVAVMTRAGALEWATILAGFIPNPATIMRPAEAFTPFLEQVDPSHRTFWETRIVDLQIDRMAAAAATAVGINMTFLFPYSILRKGWTKEFRGLAIFDLATGMFIPFVLATSCVVIASASRFHAVPVPGLAEPVASEDITEPPTAKETADFNNTMRALVMHDLGEDAFERLASGESAFEPLQMAEPSLFENADVVEIKRLLGEAQIKQRMATYSATNKRLAAMLVERDANRLAISLAPLTGNDAANILFGIGVVGMTLSTITLLMLISGFVICEMFNLKPTGWSFRLACLPAAVGVLGPFVWSKAGFALAVPTSVFGLMLLPIAYLTFFLLMNQRSLLGDQMPKGGVRVVWNLLMVIAAAVASVASIYMVWDKAKERGLIAIAILLGLALLVQIYRWIRPSRPNQQTPTAN